METQTLPRWRARLMQAHEHETVPAPGKRADSPQAQTAKMIRQTLKRVFPGVAFSVTSKGYSGGNHVRVRWTDGPTEKMVESVANRHEMGTFDGSQDLYVYDNHRDDIPQARFVFCDRDYSRETYAAAIEVVNRFYGHQLRINARYVGIDEASNPWNNGTYPAHDLYRYLKSLSLICDACDAPILPGDAYCPNCGAKLPDFDPNTY